MKTPTTSLPHPPSPQIINPLMKMMRKEERAKQGRIKEERRRRTPLRGKKENQEDLTKLKTSLKTWMNSTPTPHPPPSTNNKENPPNPTPSRPSRRQLNVKTVETRQKTVENLVKVEKKTVKREDSTFKKAQKMFSKAEKTEDNLNCFENWKRGHKRSGKEARKKLRRRRKWKLWRKRRKSKM